MIHIMEVMHQFYRLFSEAVNASQAYIRFADGDIMKHLVSQLSETVIMQQDVSQKVAGDVVFRISWGHIIQTKNKTTGDREGHFLCP